MTSQDSSENKLNQTRDLQAWNGIIYCMQPVQILFETYAQSTTLLRSVVNSGQLVSKSNILYTVNEFSPCFFLGEDLEWNQFLLISHHFLRHDKILSKKIYLKHLSQNF
jgi:hypothetical protein